MKLSQVMALAFCLTFTPMCIASWSVWEQARADAYRGQGKIRSFTESDNEVLVRVEILRPEPASANRVHGPAIGKLANVETKRRPVLAGELRTLRICNDGSYASVEEFRNSRSVKVIREAAARGEPIEFGYGGAFDSCLKTVDFKFAGEQAAQAL